MSAHIISLLRDCKIKSKKSEEVEKSENTQINDVLNNVSPSILSQLDDEFIKNCSTYSEFPLNTALEDLCRPARTFRICCRRAFRICCPRTIRTCCPWRQRIR